jgi:hypothetical protein
MTLQQEEILTLLVSRVSLPSRRKSLYYDSSAGGNIDIIGLKSITSQQEKIFIL